MNAPGTYFAAEDPTRIVAALRERADQFYRHIEKANIVNLLRKLNALSQGLTVNGTGAASFTLSRAGERGELIHGVENHFASIGNNLVTLTTAQRPAIQCGAANSDYKSLAHAILANGLVEYHLTERKLEDKLKRATRWAVFLLEGHVLVEWDVLAGQPHLPPEEPAQDPADPAAPAQPEQSAMLREGDVRVAVLGLLDVVRDVESPSWEACEWILCREWVNKYGLAARRTEQASEILGASATERELGMRIGFGARDGSESDLVPLWKFFHKDSDALPGGRHVRYVGDVVLYDGPNPYGEDLPDYRVTPEEIDGTPFGTTPLIHLMGPQDAINALDTTILTNQLGRGVGNMVSDGDVTVEQIATSMNLIKTKPGAKLEALEWPATPKELFDYKDSKVSVMEVLSSINSVVRGNPSDNVGADASGAKLALIAAQAVQANSGLQGSYANLVRDVALAHIRRYRDFGGDVPRLARIAGKQQQYMLKEFTSGDLQEVDRVTVDLGSPLMRTVSGKMTVADKVMALPAEARAPYLALIKTGTYEPLFEADQSQAMRIRSENEQLMEGGTHRALLTDPHWLEIPQHLTVLDNPSLRETTPENEAVQNAVLMAVQEHLQLFRQMPPELVLMRGGPPALAMWQQFAQMAMAPMGGTAPPQQGAQSGTPPPDGGATDATNPEASQPELAGMPSMPMRPDTGEPYQPAGGELPQ